MKKSFLIFFSNCCQLAFGQKKRIFSLSGTINLDSGTTQFLPVGSSNDYPDSILYLKVPVKSGSFYFEGKIKQTVKITLQARVAGRNVYWSNGIYIIPGSQSIRCKLDTISYDRETPKRIIR